MDIGGREICIEWSVLWKKGSLLKPVFSPTRREDDVGE